MGHTVCGGYVNGIPVGIVFWDRMSFKLIEIDVDEIMVSSINMLWKKIRSIEIEKAVKQRQRKALKLLSNRRRTFFCVQ